MVPKISAMVRKQGNDELIYVKDAIKYLRDPPSEATCPRVKFNYGSFPYDFTCERLHGGRIVLDIKFGNFDDSISKHHDISGRLTSMYYETFPELEGLTKSLIDAVWIEVGPGLSDFVVYLARRENEGNYPKPVIIEPFDYFQARDFLVEINAMLPEVQFSPSSNIYADSIGSVLERISILTNPDFVTWLHTPLDSDWRVNFQEHQKKIQCNYRLQ